MASKYLIIASVFVILALFLGGFLAGYSTSRPEEQASSKVIMSSEGQASNIGFVAVDSQGAGVTGDIDVTVRSGSGLVLVNVNNVLADYDTQQSARIAVKVAEQYTGVDLSDKDVILSLNVGAQIVSGASAGSAMAIAIIAAIEDKPIHDGTLITGAINYNGTILPVGSVIAKAQAAKSVGAYRFLVPANQSREIIRTEKRECGELNGMEYCRIEYVPKALSVEEEAGIRVIEVESIAEAASYFFA